MEKSELVKKTIIEKWMPIFFENLSVMDARLLSLECCLCKVYGYGCQGCPIYAHTGKDNCYSTPYWDWYKKYEGDRSLAREELLYLIKIFKIEKKKERYGNNV